MLLFAFTIWIVAMILGVIIAGNKGRSKLGWFLLTCFLPISLLILLALASKKTSLPVVITSSTDTLETKCPDCAEMVKRGAKKCRFCNHEFMAETVPRKMRMCPSCHEGMPAREKMCLVCGVSSPPKLA